MTRSSTNVCGVRCEFSDRHASMLKQVLPLSTVIVATQHDIISELYPEEEVAIQNAVASRRREFTTTRACARKALTQLGLKPRAIPVGRDGEPIWPIGVVGSITHCDGYRAAATAYEKDVTMIGIDAEPDKPLPRGVLKVIALPSELEWVMQYSQKAPYLCWDRLLFSIKEAVYKACFPFCASNLGFKDVAISVDPVSECFHAQLRPGLVVVDGFAGSGFVGCWRGSEGLVTVGMALSKGDREKPTSGGSSFRAQSSALNPDQTGATR